MGHSSPRKLYEGKLEEGLLYWRPRRIRQVRLWKWAPASIGAQLVRNMERRRDSPCLGPLRKGKKFLFREIFYE